VPGLWQEQVPQLLRARLLLQLLDDGGGLPPPAGIELLLVALLVGMDVPSMKEASLQRCTLGE
jgi:hypothetical protein